MTIFHPETGPPHCILMRPTEHCQCNMSISYIATSIKPLTKKIRFHIVSVAYVHAVRTNDDVVSVRNDRISRDLSSRATQIPAMVMTIWICPSFS